MTGKHSDKNRIYIVSPIIMFTLQRCACYLSKINTIGTEQPIPGGRFNTLIHLGSDYAKSFDASFDCLPTVEQEESLKEIIAAVKKTLWIFAESIKSD